RRQAPLDRSFQGGRDLRTVHGLCRLHRGPARTTSSSTTTRPGSTRPFHVDEEGGIADCTRGEKGCTLCTRACPRFREWETEVDTFLFGRERLSDEVFGVSQEVVLARATDPDVNAAGQDGGLVSAILIYALENDV
ncbi:hydrogenase, partial [mine drainage metagenome]